MIGNKTKTPLLGTSDYFTTYWARSLYYSLKTRIKGSVYCDIQDDTLVVTIYGVNNIVWRYKLCNIHSEIVHGLDVQMVTHTVVKRYKGYILNLYLE